MSKILGKNLRYYPSQYDPENPLGEEFCKIVVVLVEGDIRDYAAYIGHGDPEWVARFGDKISFEEACVHFPGGQLKRELYRD